MAADTETLRRTPLYDLHVELGARMVPFAGYSMPVQYEGILAEHRWTREHAGLFDVSHMGQRFLVGPDHATTAAALEALTPGDFAIARRSAACATRCSSTTSGGIIDDLMVTRSNSADDDGALGLVFNAGRKEIDDAYVRARLPDRRDAARRRRPRAARAAGAGGGEGAWRATARRPTDLVFMTRDQRRVRRHRLRRLALRLYRRGRLRDFRRRRSDAEQVARALLAEPEVKPIGLGARDSLRLEAGLPLYGHDLDETTSPVEADLTFAIAKRAARRAAAFPAPSASCASSRDGPSRKRVGIRPTGRAPVRDGAEIVGAGRHA